MDKYTIEKFKPEHANYILSFGEVENYSKEYDTKDSSVGGFNLNLEGLQGIE